MKKSFKIEVDCANCANRIEAALSKLEGVNSVVVNFMTQKMKVDIDDNADVDALVELMRHTACKIEPDFVMK